MSRTMLALIPLAVLAACGGDGEPPGTSADLAWSTQCAASPETDASTTYLGVTPDGRVGTWHVDTRALVANYAVGDARGTTALRREAATCSYLGADTGALRTAFLANGLAVSAADVGGEVQPAILMTDPEPAPAAIAGAYKLVRFMRLTQATGSQVLAGSGVFTIDAQGAWSLCLDAAPGPACTPETGIAAARSDGSFDVVMSGQVHARMMVKVSGDSRLLLMAIDNPFDPALTISGMWIGTPGDAPPAAGRWLADDSDAGSHALALSAAGLATDGGAPAPLTLDVPQAGYLGFASAAGPGIGLVSRLGVIATATSTASGATIAFGVASAAP